MAAATKRRRGKSNLTKAIEEIGMLRQKQEDTEKETGRRLAGMNSMILGLPTKHDVTELRDLIVGPDGNLKLATREDVQEVVSMFKNIKTASAIISGSGHWAWRVLVGIAMLIAVITFIGGGYKAAVGFLVNHALGGQ